jgi:hypothetical protein
MPCFLAACYHLTRRYIPQECSVYVQGRENLKLSFSNRIFSLPIQTDVKGVTETFILIALVSLKSEQTVCRSLQDMHCSCAFCVTKYMKC